MKILNFGSLNIDFVYSVPYFVRPGETLSSLSLEKFCGGKGLNQSVAFARAGAKVYHAGCIGTDGGMLVDMLKSAGADTSFVTTLDGVATGNAIIQVSADGENCIILHGGANREITDKMIDKTLSHFDRGDAVILQNEINGIAKILEKAKARGMITVLNPSPFNEVITALDLTLVDYLIINETEGKGISGKEDADEITSELLRLYPDMKIVLTLGKDGAVYCDKTQKFHQPIIEAKVVDTTGAGDTFTGYFFASVFGGKTPKDALYTATAASSVAVSKKGAATSIPTLDEVLEIL